MGMDILVARVSIAILEVAASLSLDAGAEGGGTEGGPHYGKTELCRA
jgi:hypothetical protein